MTNGGILPTEQVVCNLCGSDESRPLFVERYRLGAAGADLRIVRCRHCGLVYVSPRLTFETIQLVYEHDSDHTISHSYCWDGDSGFARFRPLLDRIQQLKTGGRLLDVGCGSGQFLAAAQRTTRWEVIGVEPSQAAADAARQRVGCRVYSDVLDRVALEPESFDVITLLGVLEHVPDPKGTLQRVHKLLKPGGLVAAYVPNFTYLRIKDSGPICWLRCRRWSDLHPQEHLHHFTARTLQALIDRTGFDLLRLDIGQPFFTGNRLAWLLKRTFYAAAWTVRQTTGWHLGGLEVIARKNQRSLPTQG